MKFDIVGVEDNYGKHRYSNNAILRELGKNSHEYSDFLFVWWVEKIFIDPSYKSTVDKLCETEWFGVMHIPLLTPNWAMYSQNNIAKLYFMESWRRALKKCRGIICLSDHMKNQIKSIYPELNVFSLKHPMEFSEKSFDYNIFSRDPQLLLVGTWLRDFDAFINIKTSWRKKILLNHYAEGFLKERYAKYSPDIFNDVKEIECINFLDNDEYDSLICSSLLFVGLQETSANNSICECIAYSVPFVARKHPAIIEYCGIDYPLLVDDNYDDKLTVDNVLKAHLYLKRNDELREELSMKRFIRGVEEIYYKIITMHKAERLVAK